MGLAFTGVIFSTLDSYLGQPLPSSFKRLSCCLWSQGGERGKKDENIDIDHDSLATVHGCDTNGVIEWKSSGKYRLGGLCSRVRLEMHLGVIWRDDIQIFELDDDQYPSCEKWLGREWLKPCSDKECKA
jgi:hypothetical protein